IYRNALDTTLQSQLIVVTRSEINGRHLGSLHLRNRYGVNVSRVKRAGLQLVATPDLVLRLGDRITVIGTDEGLKRVSEELGNAVSDLDEPNLIVIFLGVVLGLLLGSIPFHFGLSYPVQLGLAGGPIVMGILMGAYGPRLNIAAYTTTSASLMLRSLGLSMYLACLGLDAGRDFVGIVMQPQSLSWILYAVLVCVIPLIVMAVIATLRGRYGYATVAGMLCGAMANPIALDYVNSTQHNDRASIAYTTVYPLAMFLRVIIAQVLVMMWFA
ncbi:MAG: transporter, partial [Bacteroidales bacterium]|nr:transporter [Candidatus Equimonas enterica]